MTAHCDSMEAYVIQEAKAGMGMDLEAADVKALAASILALRERAEAARRRGDILAEGWQIADEGRIEAEAALTAARRAEAAAWQAGFAAAKDDIEDRINNTDYAMNYHAPLTAYIRALRRSAPTEDR